MTDLDHKRRQARAKADQNGCPWVLYVDPQDIEPQCILDAPEFLVPDWADVLEKIYPRKPLVNHWDTCAVHMGMACSCGLETK